MKSVRALEIAKKVRSKKIPDESVSPVKSSIVSQIMAKKMNKGGMVDEPESEEMGHEMFDDHFLSDGEQDYALDETYPDHEESQELDPKKERLKKVFSKIHEK